MELKSDFIIRFPKLLFTFRKAILKL